VLYAALGGEPKTSLMAARIIGDLSLASFEKNIELLEQGNAQAKHDVVQIVEAHQLNYRRSDIALVGRLMEAIQAAFPDRATTVQSKGLLGGTKTTWVCGSCGEQGNPAEAARCKSCGRDPQGFRHNEIGVAKALELLRERRQSLVDALYGPVTA
jgi:hypothetical protein